MRTVQGIVSRISMRHSIAALEFALLLVVLLWWNPFEQLTFSLKESPSRWSFAKQVVLALGQEIQGGYPYFSEAVFSDFFREAMESPSLQSDDLRKKYEQWEWPQQPYLPWRYHGGDIGSVLLFHYLWEMSGDYSLARLQSIYAAALLSCTVILFFSLLVLRTPGIALLGALGFAFSPAIKAQLESGFHYLSNLIVCVCISGALLLIGTLLNRREYWRWPAIALALLLGVALAMATELRGSAIVLLPGVLLVIGLQGKRHSFFASGLLITAVVLSFAVSRLQLTSRYWDQTALSHNVSRGHVFYHAIWAGLGEFENPHGFVWSDRAAKAFVAAREPSAAYASEAYEAVLRDHILETLQRDPLWFLGTVVKRFLKFGTRWRVFVPGGKGLPRPIALLLMCAAFLSIAWSCRRNRSLNTLSLTLPSLCFLAQPLGIHSGYHMYNLAGYLSVYLGLLILLTQLLRLIKVRCSAGAKRETRLAASCPPPAL